MATFFGKYDDCGFFRFPGLRFRERRVLGFQALVFRPETERSLEIFPHEASSVAERPRCH